MATEWDDWLKGKRRGSLIREDFHPSPMKSTLFGSHELVRRTRVRDQYGRYSIKGMEKLKFSQHKLNNLLQYIREHGLTTGKKFLALEDGTEIYIKEVEGNTRIDIMVPEVYPIKAEQKKYIEKEMEYRIITPIIELFNDTGPDGISPNPYQYGEIQGVMITYLFHNPYFYFTKPMELLTVKPWNVPNEVLTIPEKFHKIIPRSKSGIDISEPPSPGFHKEDWEIDGLPEFEYEWSGTVPYDWINSQIIKTTANLHGEHTDTTPAHGAEDSITYYVNDLKYGAELLLHTEYTLVYSRPGIGPVATNTYTGQYLGLVVYTFNYHSETVGGSYIVTYDMYFSSAVTKHTNIYACIFSRVTYQNVVHTLTDTGSGWESTYTGNIYIEYILYAGGKEVLIYDETFPYPETGELEVHSLRIFNAGSEENPFPVYIYGLRKWRYQGDPDTYDKERAIYGMAYEKADGTMYHIQSPEYEYIKDRGEGASDKHHIIPPAEEIANKRGITELLGLGWGRVAKITIKTFTRKPEV